MADEKVHPYLAARGFLEASVNQLNKLGQVGAAQASATIGVGYALVALLERLDEEIEIKKVVQPQLELSIPCEENYHDLCVGNSWCECKCHDPGKDNH